MQYTVFTLGPDSIGMSDDMEGDIARLDMLLEEEIDASGLPSIRVRAAMNGYDTIPAEVYGEEEKDARLHAAVDRAWGRWHGDITDEADEEEPIITRGTLAHVLTTETIASLETHNYVINVREIDELDPDAPEMRYELNVCHGGMPPHASHEFRTLAEVEAYIASGEALDVTADDTRWQSVVE